MQPSTEPQKSPTSDLSKRRVLRKTRASGNGRSFPTSIKTDGRPLLAQSSNHPEALIDSAARATYTVLMNGMANYDTASEALRHKSRQIAIAVLDAKTRFEDHHP